jgi:hypothetical protein
MQRYRHLSFQWRPCWWYLDAGSRLYWHVLCYAFICGNGVDVSLRIADTNKILAHQSDRAPIAGGQYHWVSELAPRKRQKFLSYVVGKLYFIAKLISSTKRMLQDGCVSSDGRSAWLVRLSR